MTELVLILIIGGPIVGFIFLLTGFIQALSKNEETNRRGRKLLIIGSLVIIVPLLIGFSICSSGFIR